jgi:hypothetical protein
MKKTGVLFSITIAIFVFASGCATLGGNHMTDTVYPIPSYFSFSQGNQWTYSHKTGDKVGEVTYVIEGYETFHGIKIPKKVQADNPDEYFCTSADSVYGIRDFKHNLGMTQEYLIYTPPTNVLPAKMKAGDIHYNAAHLFRHNKDGTIKDEGSFYDTTILEAVEAVTVPAGRFEDCLKVTLIRDDVFSEIVVNVVLTQWLARGVGIVKSNAKVNIYSPQGGEPFTVEASEELKKATVDGKSY